MIAVASDIHGNLDRLEAFSAAVADIASDDVFILGDLVKIGRTPEDNACIQLARHRGYQIVRGNHEGFMSLRAAFIDTTRSSAQNKGTWDLDALMFDDNVNFIDGLPERIERDGLVFAHAIPSHHKVRTLEDATLALREVTSMGAIIAFVGHFHQPNAFYHDPSVDVYGEVPNAAVTELRHGMTYLINPGSLDEHGAFVRFNEQDLVLRRERVTS